MSSSQRTAIARESVTFVYHLYHVIDRQVKQLYQWRMRTLIATVIFLLLAPAARLLAATGKLDPAKIETLTGAHGKLDEKEGVFKVSFPRSDLTVTSSGVKITPPMGLTVWASFKNVGGHTMVMGDTVMTEDQVAGVMSVALDNGLEVTA